MDNIGLSQDEVDTLLQDAPAAEFVSEEPVPASSEPRPYDLGNATRVVRGPVPGLEQIHERFVKAFTDELTGLLRKPPVVSAAPVQMQTFATFLRKVGSPTSANLVALRPFSGSGLIVLDPSLVDALVDCLFGGGGTPAPIEGRSFSATEQSIILRVVQLAIRQYCEAWQPVHELQMEYLGADTDPQVLAIAGPSDNVASVSFKIEIGSLKGELHLCLPYTSLEPVHAQLFAPAQGPRSAGDPGWVDVVSHQLGDAQVEVVAHLTDIETTVRGLLNLRVGQVLECRIPEALDVAIEGVPFMLCQYGTHNERLALRVQKFIGQGDGASGSSHKA